MIGIDDVVQSINATFSGCKVCFSRKDVPQNLVLPKDWELFGLRLEETAVYPQRWDSFSNEFPSVIALLRDCLLGTVLLLGDEVEMLYVFHDGKGFYYYLGGMPVERAVVEKAEFKHLPSRLQDFYREVHDGYTFFPARSMGPQRLSDQSRVSELVDEGDDSFAENWITVFSNGGGDYVAVESDKLEETEGLIWWHEDPMTPEWKIDIFEVMDAWMSIFLEDIKPRAELVAKFY